jgi:hypothetical protein
MRNFIASSLVTLSLVAAGYAQSSTTGVIHPAKDTNKCLDVAAGVFANGTPVQM